MQTLHTYDEAAALLHLHRKTLEDYVRRGELVVTRFGRRVLIAERDLEAFVLAHRDGPPTAVSSPVLSIGRAQPKGRRRTA